MTDDELKQSLRHLEVPLTEQETRDHVLAVSLAALGLGVESPRKREFSRSWRWSWIATPAFAGLLACVIVGKLMWPGDSRQTDAARVFAEVEALFPSQLSAVVEHGSLIDLQLGSAPVPQSDQRVVVTFTRGRETVRVLSYSGRHACAALGGHTTCFEALIDQRGEVVIAGDDFVGRTGGSVRGWRIAATALPHSS